MPTAGTVAVSGRAVLAGHPPGTPSWATISSRTASAQFRGDFHSWWQVLGSNQRRRSRRFYRPLPLAARATCQGCRPLDGTVKDSGPACSSSRGSAPPGRPVTPAGARQSAAPSPILRDGQDGAARPGAGDHTPAGILREGGVSAVGAEQRPGPGGHVVALCNRTLQRPDRLTRDAGNRKRAVAS